MIVFIAPNPTNTKEREGFLQRVAVIDELFSGEDKYYYEDFNKDYKELAKILAKAHMIYVHSIYQAEKILQNYPLLGSKIITDLHGVVPEEEKYAGNEERSKRMAEIESIVFDHCTNFVAVSYAMAEHFKEKYVRAKKAEWIILPIFNTQLARHSDSKRPNVIYAGGAQRWQNVSYMVEAINSTYEHYDFTILTHSPDAFASLTPSAAAKTVLKAAPSAHVGKYYRHASLGFILRDNIAINNVACPTKLIEYLANSVVPVVLSPKIGDFEKLGYAYFTIEEFMEQPIPLEMVSKAAKKNLVVFEKMRALAADGANQLKAVYTKLKKTKPIVVVDEKLYLELLAKNCLVSVLEIKIEANEHQIATQAKMIEDYAEAVRYHRKELEEIRATRYWQTYEAFTRSKKRVRNMLRKRKPSK